MQINVIERRCDYILYPQTEIKDERQDWSLNCNLYLNKSLSKTFPVGVRVRIFEPWYIYSLLVFKDE